jgi:putative addiction module component (TIGR02574 family)
MKVMTQPAKQIVKDALALSDAERSEVAAILLRSLPDSDPGFTKEDLAEWERRAKAIENGTVETIPWEEVRAEVQRRIDDSANTV